MGNSRSKKILLVDDDAMVRRMTATILKSDGYEVIEASSGAEGLERFAEHQTTIGLVVSDAVMPQMTGPEMIEKILVDDPLCQ